MAENSPHSQTKEKRSTRKTVSLTAEQAIEILQQSVIYCQQAGITMQLSVTDNVNDTALIMRGVVLIDGNLKVKP